MHSIFLKSSVSPTFAMKHAGSCFDFCGVHMFNVPASSVSSVESTTTKGLIRIYGRDSWVIDPDIFPVGADPQKKVKFLLRYAVLAPSLYNVQPWLFRVEGPQVSLYANRLLSLVATDPDDRALMLSCGAVLQYLWLAARHYRYEGMSHIPLRFSYRHATSRHSQTLPRPHEPRPGCYLCSW